MPADAAEKVIQFVTDGHSADDPGSVERKEKRGSNVIPRKTLTSRLLLEHLEVTSERHPLVVGMQEGGHLWSRGAVRAQELLLLAQSRQSKLHTGAVAHAFTARGRPAPT